MPDSRLLTWALFTRGPFQAAGRGATDFVNPAVAGRRANEPVRAAPTLSSAIQDVIDPEAQISPWFLVGRPRENVKKIAVEILKNGKVGEFFVRDVSSQPGHLGLSIKTSRKDLTNYLLKAVPSVVGNGVTVRGTKEVFRNITQLIVHYRRKKRPSLPCKLVESSQIRGLGVRPPS